MSADKLRIVEGVSGTWFYHLARESELTTALCGARTMETRIPLTAWGKISHLNERWCAKCSKELVMDIRVELVNLEELLETTLPAPWSRNGNAIFAEDKFVGITGVNHPWHEANAELIVRCRNLLPRLIELIRDQDVTIDELRYGKDSY